MSTGKPAEPRTEKLLPTQRQSFILDVLVDKKAATLHQLAERLGASFSTIRRDLDELARRGLIQRTHGGATLISDPPVWKADGDQGGSLSRSIQLAKESIGRVAASRVREGDSVIFDSSITVMEAARVIVASRLRITAVTNSIKIAELLAAAESVRLIVPGGTRRPGTNVLAGEPGDSFFSRLHADIALIGAQSASDGVLTDSRIEGASSKRLLMNAVRTRLLLIDSWKFGGPGFCEVASLSEFDEVITDDGLSAEVEKDLERRGIFVRTERSEATAPRGRGQHASSVSPPEMNP